MTTEQKGTVVTLFECAVNKSISTYVEKVNEQMQALVDAEVKEVQENLRLKMKDYLKYAVESWAEENAEAIKATMQAKLDSDCVNKIKAAFTESYVSVPEDKKDMLNDLTEEVEKAELARDNMFEEAREVKAELFKLQKIRVVEKLTSEMAETEKESIQLTLEHVQASDIEDFTKQAGLVVKAKTVKQEKVVPKADDKDGKTPAVTTESNDEKKEVSKNIASQFGL
ncbi:MAG: hypothetical protein QM489_01050 [Candidatus Izemoplasma sp.]